MIDYPIIDTHLHLWHPEKLHYPWLADLPVLDKPHLLEDYGQAWGPYDIGQMVFVQCEVSPTQYREEVDWVTSLAKQDSRIAGIVSWAPLEKGDGAQAELEALAANPRVKGIRRIIQFESSADFCLAPNFVKGVQQLAPLDFSFDLCIKGPQQTVNAIELVKRCPRVKFILNHIGKPYIAKKQLDPWKAHIAQLAALPNTWCKMSGLVVEADMAKWTLDDLKPYYDHVIASFGVDRIMFGGDWPVVAQAADLHQWIATLETLTLSCSASEKRKMFRENAMAFYRLNPNDG